MISLKPWDTPKENLKLDKTITLVFIAFTLFIMIYNISISTTSTLAFKQQSITIFIIFLLIISYFSIDTSNYGGFGTNRAGGLGILVGGIVGISAILISNMRLSLPPLTVLSSDVILSAIYVALVIPFIEEKFFGRILPFVFRDLINSPIIVLVLSSVVFGLFHFFAYNANFQLIVSAMVFRACILIGNELLKTSLFGDSIHYINNIIYVIRGVS